MLLESPAFTRCCFCVPLRRGLIGWGYVRLAMGILALVHFILISIWLLSDGIHANHIILAILTCSACLLDIAINLILVVAGHKKSAKLLSISFILGVMWLLMFLALSSYIMYCDIRRTIQYWHNNPYQPYWYLSYVYSPLVSVAFNFAITFVHMYVLLMIRSEAKKLRNQSVEMQFVNNAAEGEAFCVCAHQHTDDQHDAVTYNNYEQDVS